MTKMNRDELIASFVEVEMIDNESFLKIKESLTRIGIANMKRDKLTQTAHILQKRGKYYIVHFLELFALDGKDTNFNEDDNKRAWVIAQLLESWGLLKIVTEVPEEYKTLKPYMFGLTIIDYKSKANWELSAKYTIGNKK